MFERLLTLPLFQGMTLKELSDVLAFVRLDFVNYQKGDEIVCQGDPCKNLLCIINGDVKTRYREENGLFTMTETLPRLGVIEPYNMFGMYQKYSRDYIFDSDGVTLNIERKVFINHVLSNQFVKINMMNIICNRYQQAQKNLCDYSIGGVADKVIRFICNNSSIQKGTKSLQIKMVDLASMLQETRLNVSITLNKMQKQGLLSLQRGIIEIPDIQELKRRGGFSTKIANN